MSYSGDCFHPRIQSITLCSPSPGTSPPEKIISSFFQSGSSWIFLCTKNLMRSIRSNMNSVPGEIELFLKLTTPGEDFNSVDKNSLCDLLDLAECYLLCL